MVLQINVVSSKHLESSGDKVIIYREPYTMYGNVSRPREKLKSLWDSVGSRGAPAPYLGEEGKRHIYTEYQKLFVSCTEGVVYPHLLSWYRCSGVKPALSSRRVSGAMTATGMTE